MTSSTRFNSGSGSDIWSHLNALDDATVRVVATRAALLAIESPAAGMFAFETDYSVLWRYTGTQWRPVGVPELPSTAVRDAVIAQPLVNDRCRVGSGTTWAEYTYTGSAWDSGSWISYTPTWTNLTLGNGTVAAAYRIEGKKLNLRITLTFGSTTTIPVPGSAFFPSLPSGAVPTSYAPMLGTGFDTSATDWRQLSFVPGAYILTPTAGRCNATVPWTWAAGDTITIGGETEIS